MSLLLSWIVACGFFALGFIVCAIFTMKRCDDCELLKSKVDEELKKHFDYLDSPIYSARK